MIECWESGKHEGTINHVHPSCQPATRTPHKTASPPLPLSSPPNIVFYFFFQIPQHAPAHSPVGSPHVRHFATTTAETAFLFPPTT